MNTKVVYVEHPNFALYHVDVRAQIYYCYVPYAVSSKRYKKENLKFYKYQKFVRNIFYGVDIPRNYIVMI